MTRFLRSVRKFSLAAVGTIALLTPTAVYAQTDIDDFLKSSKEDQPVKITKPSMQQIDRSELLANGDANMVIDYIFTKEHYQSFKTHYGSGATAIRRFGMADRQFMIENPKLTWVDSKYTMQLRCLARGAARVNKKGEWEIELIKFEKSSQITLNNTSLKFKLSCDPTAVVDIVVDADFKMPEGTTAPKITSDGKLTYRLPAKATAQGAVSVEFDATAKEYVMSSLAKSLGNKKFKDLWTCRSTFKNTGERNLNDYRVRFRIADYSATWSSWSGSKLVVPGQSVVDLYFPTFDMDKITKTTGQSKMALEIEYQYRGPDGQIVTDTDTKDLLLLSRNNVYYSSMQLKDQNEFLDIYHLGPQVISSFVNFEDPIVQQASGRISNSMGGSQVQSSDEDALAYMEATYKFMAANIRYQAAVSNSNDLKFIQHVKYARDVLRNRSGTCIDLAITYASLCQAGGLEPVIYLIQGHAFAAVKLPKSGRIVPVECTAIGKENFDKAVEIDEKAYFSKMINKSLQFFEIDICKLQKEGVVSVDLPAVSEDVLEKWGIKFPKFQRDEKESKPKPNTTTTTSNKQPTKENANFELHALWVGEIENKSNGSVLVTAIEFSKDGNFELAVVVKGSNKKPQGASGKYTVSGNRITLTWDNTGDTVMIHPNEDKLTLIMQGTTVTMKRYKQQ